MEQFVPMSYPLLMQKGQPLRVFRLSSEVRDLTDETPHLENLICEFDDLLDLFERGIVH